MRSKFSAVGCSILFFLLLYINGCQLAHFAGGGFTYYDPPDKIACDKPWEITVVYSISTADPKEKYGKLAERWKDATIRIRDSSKGDFLAVPMVIQSVDLKTGESYFKATMKPIPCDSNIAYLEYYIDVIFDNNYNRTTLYRVPVGRN
jgi:hypothetical protein